MTAGGVSLNRSMRWTTALFDELARCGLRHVVVSPGSRSAPLALAAFADRRLTVHVRIDERSAGYFAIGLARATDQPVALVCTSGSALANYHPAVLEADQANLGLVVVSADRPHELRDVGANQAISQRGLFGAAVRFHAELMLPEEEGFRHLRHVACRAMAHARKGPVHLNVPLRGPLDASVPATPGAKRRPRLEERGRPAGAPWVTIAPAPIAVPMDGLPREGRGVVVVGPHQGDWSKQIGACEAAGIPVLCDAVSGHRRGIVHADAWLSHATTRRRLRPDWIVHVGATPTSKIIRDWMTNFPCWRVDGGRLWDDTEAAQRMVVADAPATLQVLGRAASAPRAWSDAWVHLDAVVDSVLEESPSQESQVARAITGASRNVFVGSSLPVRDLQQYGRPRNRPVVANRGTSGIDGALSSIAGAAAGGGRWLGYVGDVTFEHDVGALALLREAKNAVVVVAANGGGRIFEHLPVANTVSETTMRRLFTTPPAADVELLARAHGVMHQTCAPEDLADLLDARTHGIVEVPLDGVVAQRQALRKRLHRAISRVKAQVS